MADSTDDSQDELDPEASDYEIMLLVEADERREEQENASPSNRNSVIQASGRSPIYVAEIPTFWMK